MILLIIILQSLSSVLCLNCSDVKQSNGFGIYVKRDLNGGRSYWVYDRNGNEWQFYLKEINGQMEIDNFDLEVHHYDGNMTIRFGNYAQFRSDSYYFDVLYNCHINTNSNVIYCNIEVKESTTRSSQTQGILKLKDPVIFKTYPKIDLREEASHTMAYNHYKAKGVNLGATEFACYSDS